MSSIWKLNCYSDACVFVTILPFLSMFCFTDVDARLSAFEASMGQFICFTGPRVHKVPGSRTDRFVFFCTWAPSQSEKYNRDRTTWAITVASETALVQEIVKHFHMLGKKRATAMYAACESSEMQQIVNIFFSIKTEAKQQHFVESKWQA
jgi:hypothetical protein